MIDTSPSGRTEKVIGRRGKNKSSYFVIALTQPQFDEREKDRQKLAKGEQVLDWDDVGNLGYVEPSSIQSYFCFKCDKEYEGPPKVKILVKEEDKGGHEDLLCSHCNEYLTTVIIDDEHRCLIDPKLVEKDLTGKFIPFTPEFIDNEIIKSIKLFDRSPHLLHRVYGDIEHWMNKGKEVDYILNKSDVYSQIKTESLEKAISIMGGYDLLADPSTLSKLYNIIKDRDNKELESTFKDKVVWYRESLKSWQENLDKERKTQIEDFTVDIEKSQEDTKKQIRKKLEELSSLENTLRI